MINSFFGKTIMIYLKFFFYNLVILDRIIFVILRDFESHYVKDSLIKCLHMAINP